MLKYLLKRKCCAGLTGLLLFSMALSGVAAPPPVHPPHDSAHKGVARHPFEAPPRGMRFATGVVKQGLAATTFPAVPGTKLTADSSPASSLSSPTVNIIFAGPNWTAADQQTVLNAVQSILKGPYLSGLNQPNYGSDGKAIWGSSFSSNTAVKLDTPFAGGKYPSQKTLDDFIKGIPKLNTPNTVNVVVNDMKSSLGAVGVNQPATNGGEAYVGTLANADGSIYKDGFTQLFSHELAEAMTSAVQVTDPGNFKVGGNQIADNEPEARHYYVSLPGAYTDATGKQVATSNSVQAYWSQKDNAFIVPSDGGALKKPVRR